MRLRWALFALFAFAALALAACADDTDEGVVTDADPADPDSGEEPAEPTDSGDRNLVITTVREPESLGADFACSATFGFVSRQALEALVQRDPETNELRPELATSWEQLDELTWRFDIREGVTFHDGSSLDADAVAGSLNWVWNYDNDHRCHQFGGPAFEATAVDDYVVEMALEEPDPIFDMRMWLVPIQSWEQVQNADLPELQQNPIGTGPYVFEEWNRGQSITLSGNPDWWGNDDPDGLGAVNFDTVEFLIRPEAQSRIAAVEAGEADFAERLPRDSCQNALGDNCEQHAGIDTAMLRIDHMSEVMGDPRIREAIALAIDKQAIGDQIIGGVPAAALVPPGSVGYSDNVEPYPHDPDRARELVEEAAADGVPVENEIVFAHEREKFAGIAEAAEAIQAMLTNVGLNVTLDIREPAVFSEEWSDPPRPIPSDRNMLVIHQHSNRFSDFQATTEAYYLCGARLSTYCNEDFDDLIAQGSVVGGQERHELFAGAMDIAYDDIAFVPIIHMDLFIGVSDRLDWDGNRPDSWMFVKEMDFQ